MKGKAETVTCTKSSCFGCKKGKCLVLVEYTNAQKKGGKCPFYKSAAELYEQDIELYGRPMHGYNEEIKGC